MCSTCNGELNYLATEDKFEQYQCKKCGNRESHHVGCKSCGSSLNSNQEKNQIMCKGCVKEIDFMNYHLDT